MCTEGNRAASCVQEVGFNLHSDSAIPFLLLVLEGPGCVAGKGTAPGQEHPKVLCYTGCRSQKGSSELCTQAVCHLKEPSAPETSQPSLHVTMALLSYLQNVPCVLRLKHTTSQLTVVPPHCREIIKTNNDPCCK